LVFENVNLGSLLMRKIWEEGVSKMD